MAGWTTLEKLLKGEIIQREEEGCDVTGFAQRLEEAAGDNGRLNRLYDELMELKPGEDFPLKNRTAWRKSGPVSRRQSHGSRRQGKLTMTFSMAHGLAGAAAVPWENRWKPGCL